MHLTSPPHTGVWRPQPSIGPHCVRRGGSKKECMPQELPVSVEKNKEDRKHYFSLSQMRTYHQIYKGHKNKQTGQSRCKTKLEVELLI